MQPFPIKRRNEKGTAVVAMPFVCANGMLICQTRC